MSTGKLCQLFGDAQSQTEVILVLSGSVGSVKIFKDMFLLLLRNSGTVINDSAGKNMFLKDCLQGKGGVFRCIGDSVVQENRQNMGNPFSIAQNEVRWIYL